MDGCSPGHSTCDGFSWLERPGVGQETVGRRRTLGHHASVARQHVLAGTGRSAAGIPPNGTKHLYGEESRQKQLHNLQVSEEQSQVPRSEPGDGLFTSTAAESQPLKITLLTVKCGFACEASYETPQGKVQFFT